MLEITQSAAEHLMEQGCTGPEVFYLGHEKAGCSGFSWDMRKISQAEAKALVKSQLGFLMRTPHGVACFVTKPLMHQNGLKIDCVSGNLGRQLIVSMPAVSNTCGCGKSFSLNENQE